MAFIFQLQKQNCYVKWPWKFQQLHSSITIVTNDSASLFLIFTPSFILCQTLNVDVVIAHLSSADAGRNKIEYDSVPALRSTGLH